MFWILVTFVVSASAIGFGVRPGVSSTTMWWIVAGGYGLLGALAAYRLGVRDVLGEKVRPKWGDLSLGILMAIGLLILAWGARAVLLPVGSRRLAWLGQLYGMLGSPDIVRGSVVMTVVVVMVSTLEELVWRGFVLEELQERVGGARAWWMASLLYAGATLPASFTLADPVAGPNPILFAGALVAGLVWSYVTRTVGRLPPAMIAHATFTYFIVTRFAWPGL